MVSNPIRRRYSLGLALLIAVVIFTSLACAFPDSSNSNTAAKETSTPREVKTVKLVFSVRDEKKEPLAGARINFLSGANPPSGTTDKNGKVAFDNFSWDADKIYKVVVESEGYEPVETTLLKEDRDGKEILIALKKLPATAQPSATVSPSPASNAATEVKNAGDAGSVDGKPVNPSSTSTPTPAPWNLIDMVMWGGLILLIILIISIPFFLWSRGKRIAFYNVKDYYRLLPKELETRLKNMDDFNRVAQAQQNKHINEKLDKILANIGQLPSRVDISQTQENILTVIARGRGGGQPPDSGYSSIKPNPPQRRSFQEEAHSLYSCLVASGTSSPEPLYLNTDARSIPEDMLVERVPFLEEVNNNQGSFVLFANGQGQGLIYPNPALSFRKALFRSVFPDLTEEAFHYKESIAPVRVSRQQDGRWKVED